MIKNQTGQKVGGQLVSAADGTAFTGAVTVYVTGDAGTQNVGSVGAGACAHEGNGYHTYAPAQAETNYDLAAFTFTGTGAVPQTVQVYTRAATPDVNVAQWLGTAVATPTTAGIPTVAATGPGIRKNVAGQYVQFFVTTTAHAPATGLVDSDFGTKTVALDNGAAAALTGTITEIDAALQPGMYRLLLAQAETNGNALAFFLLATDCDPCPFTIHTVR